MFYLQMDYSLSPEKGSAYHLQLHIRSLFWMDAIPGDIVATKLINIQIVNESNGLF